MSVNKILSQGPVRGPLDALAQALPLAYELYFLPVAHPVVLHHGCRYWHIHDENLVLLGGGVLARYLWDQHDVAGFPGSKSCRIIVGRRIVLNKDVAGDILRSLG